MATFKQEKAQEILAWMEEVVEGGVFPFLAFFRDNLNDILSGMRTDSMSNTLQEAYEFLERVRSETRASQRDRIDVGVKTVRKIRDALGVIARDEHKIEGMPGAQNEYKAAQRETSEECSHSLDFTSVNWFGTRFAFVKGNQASAVKALWEAWETGDHSLSQETIGEKCGSVAGRFVLSQVFRRRKRMISGYEKHPAWGTMIQAVSKGCYLLVPPEPAQ